MLLLAEACSDTLSLPSPSIEGEGLKRQAFRALRLRAPGEVERQEPFENHIVPDIFRPGVCGEHGRIQIQTNSQPFRVQVCMRYGLPDQSSQIVDQRLTSSARYAGSVVRSPIIATISSL